MWAAISLAAVPLVLAVPTSTSAAPRPLGLVSGLASLDGIACPTDAHCVAVGSDGNGNGKTAVVNAANATGTAWSGSLKGESLFGVACASATACIGTASAVIVRIDPANGVATFVRKLTAPAGEIAVVDTLACPSPTECFGVGFIGTQAHSKGLVVRFGPTGALEATTQDSAATGFGGIACPTATQCLVAAADYPHAESIQLLVNGHLSTKHPLALKTYVQYLACYKNVACYALGGQSNGNPDLLYELNPATGTIGARHTIGGSFSGNGMACPTANVCIVDGFSSGHPAVVVVTRGIPGAPRRVGGVGLSGIGCTSNGTCFGVGQQGTSGLVEKV